MSFHMNAIAVTLVVSSNRVLLSFCLSAVAVHQVRRRQLVHDRRVGVDVLLDGSLAIAKERRIHKVIVDILRENISQSACHAIQLTSQRASHSTQRVADAELNPDQLFPYLAKLLHCQQTMAKIHLAHDYSSKRMVSILEYSLRLVANPVDKSGRTHPTRQDAAVLVPVPNGLEAVLLVLDIKGFLAPV